MAKKKTTTNKTASRGGKTKGRSLTFMNSASWTATGVISAAVATFEMSCVSTQVMGPGNYSPRDYLRSGVGMRTCTTIV